MKCKNCKEEMNIADVYDDPNKGFAHNIFLCDDCGTVLINRVWKNEGNTWINSNGEIVEEKREKCKYCHGDGFVKDYNFSSPVLAICQCQD